MLHVSAQVMNINNYKYCLLISITIKRIHDTEILSNICIEQMTDSYEIIDIRNFI